MTYKISTIGKKSIAYNVDNIKKGDRNNEKERKDLLITIIKKNPLIPHTHVIQLADKIASMPKATVEKYLEHLENEGLIHYTKLGNSPNASKLWTINGLLENNGADKIPLVLEGLLNMVKKYFKTFKKMDIDKKEKTVLTIMNLMNAMEFMMFGVGKISTNNYQTDFEKLKISFYELIIRDEELMEKILNGHILPKLISTSKELAVMLEFKKEAY